MSEVRIDDPARMNVLGLFLAAALRRNLVERGRRCRLRGTMTVDAEGMRASVRFEPDRVVVTREETAHKVVLSAPLHRFVQALTRRTLRSFLRVKIRGSRLFCLRAMRYLLP